MSSDTLRGSDEMKMLSGSEKLCRALTKVPCAGGPWEWIAETSIPLSSVFPAKHLNFAGCLGCCEVNCCKSRLPGFNPDAFSAEQSSLLLTPPFTPPGNTGFCEAFAVVLQTQTKAPHEARHFFAMVVCILVRARASGGSRSKDLHQRLHGCASASLRCRCQPNLQYVIRAFRSRC